MGFRVRVNELEFGDGRGSLIFWVLVKKNSFFVAQVPNSCNFFIWLNQYQDHLVDIGLVHVDSTCP